MIDLVFDPVHDIQKGFRCLLDCFAYPGTRKSVLEQFKDLGTGMAVSPALQYLALMLLDAETSFSVLGAQKKEAETWLSRLCYAKPSPVENSLFVLVPSQGRQDAQALASTLGHCHRGTLENPHTGATLLFEVPDLDQGTRVELRGPGIKDCLETILPLEPEVLSVRKDLNREFPLGVDLVLIDGRGSLVCLPRTTLVEVL